MEDTVAVPETIDSALVAPVLISIRAAAILQMVVALPDPTALWAWQEFPLSNWPLFGACWLSEPGFTVASDPMVGFLLLFSFLETRPLKWDWKLSVSGTLISVQWGLISCNYVAITRPVPSWQCLVGNPVLWMGSECTWLYLFIYLAAFYFFINK